MQASNMIKEQNLRRIIKRWTLVGMKMKTQMNTLMMISCELTLKNIYIIIENLISIQFVEKYILENYQKMQLII